MANTFELITGSTLGSAASSFSFSSIPSGYTDLQIFASVRQDSGIYNYADGRITINGGGTAVTSRSIYGEASVPVAGSNTSIYLPVTTSTATANTFSSFSLYFANYLSSAYKSFSADAVSEANNSSAATEMHAYLWSNTSAITSITLSPSSGNFVAQSSFYLYGVKNA
jgi:hypothetical protein